MNVSLRVTSQPIGQPSSSALEFRIAQDTPKQKQNVRMTNAGLGALQVTGVSVSTQSGSNWLSAEQLAEPYTDFIAVTADPAGLSPGIYQGAVSVAANAANAPIAIPVRLEITQQTAPAAAFQGVVNNATFAAGESVAQGDIVAVFGDQLAYGDPQAVTELPLKTTMGGATVFVNDKPAPLYFTSYNQITFQMPFDATPGEARVRIDRDGQRGNTIGVDVQPRVARILRLGIGDYGIIVNQDASFPLPATPGVNARPARAGDTLVIYAIGLGPTSPAVASGEASPSSPLAPVIPAPNVVLGTLFGPGATIAPFYAGLTPGFVGLYQINFTVPADAPRGDAVTLFLDSGSNKVSLAIQ